MTSRFTAEVNHGEIMVRVDDDAIKPHPHV